MLDAEIELEISATQNASDRYRSELIKSKLDGTYSNTKSVTRLITNTLDLYVNDGINKYLEHYSTGKAVRATKSAAIINKFNSTETVGLIASKMLFNSFNSNMQSVAVFKSIGQALEDEYKMEQCKQANKSYYNSIKKDLTKKGAKAHRIKTVTKLMFEKRQDFHQDKWSITDKVQVGKVLTDIFIETTALANYEDVYVKGKVHRLIVPTKLTEDWLADLDLKFEVLNPVMLPMVCPPKDWISVYEGGYISPYMRKNKLIKSKSKTYLRKLEAQPMETVYSALKQLQNTGYMVNQKVHKTLIELWDKGLAVAGLPSREDEVVPEFPYPDKEKEDRTETEEAEIKEWKRIAYDIHQRNIQRRSVRILTAQIIRIATQYKNYERFYYPYQMDFRGRIYPIPIIFNPQGTDVAKGLLLFADGKLIKGNPQAIKWLEVHGANVYGFDKASYDDRAEWIRARKDEIKSYAENPTENLGWTNADKPVQFLAFCFEYAEYLENPEKFRTHLPIQLDGTCNGCQHYAALLRDKVAAKSVNLLDSDTPNDIYADVANKLLDKLKEIKDNVNSTEIDKKNATNWMKLGIDRKCVKPSVMTLPYGSKRYSCGNFIQDYLKEHYSKDFLWQHFSIGNSPNDCILKISVWLSKYLWQAIENTLTSAIIGMDFLTKVAKCASKNNQYLEWTTPAGLLVRQDYKSRKKQFVRTELFGSIVKTTVNVDTEELDNARQVSGIAPNFIHSLDAACLMIYLNKCKANGINSIMTIHDCYATHATDTEMSAKLLREAFVEVYKQPILENFLKDIKNLLPEGTELPEIPENGDLDINDVLSSKYFFN